jgi:hypothetical protein
MMPMMPGMGAGQPGNQRGDERSDASGLIAAQSQPWTEGDEQRSEAVGVSDGAAADGEAARLGADAALAAAEPEATGEEAYEYAGFDDDGEEEEGVDHEQREHDDNRVPVVGAGGSDDDLSAWDLAGAAADAALFTLGAWANRRRSREEETFGRIVSTEEAAWLGDDASLPDAEEEADGLPAATWRPNRDISGSSEPRLLSAGGTMLRSAPPPKDYDPVAVAEAAAAAAEAEEAERQAALEAEEEEKRKRAPADLLTQDRDMWGSPKADWEAL